MAHRARVTAALVSLVAGKLALIAVPVLLKRIVDTLSVPTVRPGLVVVPVGLILAYGAARLGTSLFNELREFFFARVTQSTIRTLALQTFEHLHALSLRFHLDRRTGAVTREIDHGVRGISSLVSFTLYSILPTLLEVGVVFAYLLWHYEIWFAVIVAISLVCYVAFTFSVTNWRTRYRREVNELDARASSNAVDSLLNFETVKYFNNEAFEAKRYDQTLALSETANLKVQRSLNLLNAGQQIIIGIGLTLMVWRAALGVQNGSMSIGDLVLVNAFLLQLYVPLNFLGAIYREIRQAVTDMHRLFELLNQSCDVLDAPDARVLDHDDLERSGVELRFCGVGFGYDPRRQVLHDVNFCVPAHTTCAVVGATGSGKSTLARLLFRFYDVQQGSITLNGHDVRTLTQASLRSLIGIVPQDTVLFNESIAYNIAYGRPGASDEQIRSVARAAQIHDFIMSLPDGYQTMVGERGLKLSGGEKQRVAIARTLLKDPLIMVFDEATSALDTRTEQSIQEALRQASAHRTALVIAHRLSTVVTADQILVMDHGRIVEHGTHTELLAKEGIYARMWALQQSAETPFAQSVPA
jgi:ATP-binding cassette subfamily B protein